jgi:hypothetical protein
MDRANFRRMVLPAKFDRCLTDHCIGYELTGLAPTVICVFMAPQLTPLGILFTEFQKEGCHVEIVADLGSP